MEILSGVNEEAGLIGFVSDTIFNFGSKHHLGALHEIIHHVLKLWLQCLLVNYVKEYFFIGGNLNTNVSTNKEDLTSHVFELVVLLPDSSFLMLLEEKN